MGYRDLEDRRHKHWEVARMRRRRASLLVGGFAYGVLAIGAGIYVLAHNEPPPPTAGNDTIVLSFGFDRDPITREYTTAIDAPAGAEEQEAIAVRFRSDLRSAERSSQFPTSQITIGVTRLAGDRVNLALTANPWSPETVPSGVYGGTVEINNAGTITAVPVQVVLEGRDRVWALLAALLLIAGSVLGLLVKWITESLTPRAGMMRRLANLRRAIGYGEDGTNLPVAVRMDVDDLQDRIELQDFARAEELFKKFDVNRLKLADISSRFDVLYDQLAEQSRVVDRTVAGLGRDDDLLLNGMLDAQYRSLLELQGAPWPDHEKEIISATTQLRTQFGVAANAVLAYLKNRPDRDLRRVLSTFQEGNFEQAVEDYRRYQEQRLQMAVSDADEAREVAQGSAGQESSSSIAGSYKQGVRDPEALSWIFRNARPIAAFASVIVVSLVGLKMEYLEKQSFDGSLGAWLTLGLWALVVELSGLSVLDVVGRLGGNAVGGTTTKP
jgi:hypothetical protein